MRCPLYNLWPGRGAWGGEGECVLRQLTGLWGDTCWQACSVQFLASKRDPAGGRRLCNVREGESPFPLGCSARDTPRFQHAILPPSELPQSCHAHVTLFPLRIFCFAVCHEPPVVAIVSLSRVSSYLPTSPAPGLTSPILSPPLFPWRVEAPAALTPGPWQRRG